MPEALFSFLRGKLQAHFVRHREPCQAYKTTRARELATLRELKRVEAVRANSERVAHEALALAHDVYGWAVHEPNHHRLLGRIAELRDRLENPRVGAAQAERPGGPLGNANVAPEKAAHLEVFEYVTWINRLRYAFCSKREGGYLTGRQIRALAFPNIGEEYDLFLTSTDGGEDLIVQDDEAVPAADRRFFTAPKVINAG